MSKQFKRGITERLQRDAAKFFEEKEAGKAICQGVKKGILYVCIRDNYFNVYRNGCALLKYSPNARDYKFLIHKKYLPDGMSPQEYSGVYASLDLNTDENALTRIYIEHVIEKPNSNLQKYLYEKNKQSEKELLQAYLESERPCLIDLEVAFSCKHDAHADKTVAKRIDLAVLEKEGEKVMLRFIEAKVASDPRLKAESKDSEVISQLGLYESFLKNEKKSILNSYKQIAQNYVDPLSNLLARSNDVDMIKGFLQSGAIDPKPSLLLLSGGDTSIEQTLKGKKGKNSGNHYKTLTELCRGKWNIIEWSKHE